MDHRSTECKTLHYYYEFIRPCDSDIESISRSPLLVVADHVSVWRRLFQYAGVSTLDRI